MASSVSNRTGTKLDLTDPQVRIDLWKTLMDHASVIKICYIGEDE